MKTKKVSLLVIPLHSKMFTMKQFVKALPKDGDTFECLANKFPRLSEAKLKEGVLVDPDIKTLMKGWLFQTKLEDIERSAWQFVKEVMKISHGNYNDPDFKNIVENMLVNLNALGCSVKLKLHFLNSYISYFPVNLGTVNEEQGERIHHDMKAVA